MLLVTAMMIAASIVSSCMFPPAAGGALFGATKTIGSILVGMVTTGAKAALSGMIIGGIMGGLSAALYGEDVWDGIASSAMSGAISGFIEAVAIYAISTLVSTVVQAIRVANADRSATNAAKWYYPDGTPRWPENQGFKGTPYNKILEKGEVIGRYGSPNGKYAAPAGTPFEQLSMPEYNINLPYNMYAVNESVTVLAGKVAPWFGYVGGGTQYLFGDTIKNLVVQGVLILL